MTEDSPNPFQAFVGALYRDDDVVEACLSLQVREGLDINLLLFCCWAGRHGHSLTRGQLERLRAASVPWQQAVAQPLRGARLWLLDQHGMPDPIPAGDPGTDRLTSAIADAEREADHLEQDILYRTLPHARGDPDIAAMVNNIHAYFGLLGRTPGPEDTADLVAIVLAGLPRDVRALDLVRRFEDGGDTGQSSLAG